MKQSKRAHGVRRGVAAVELAVLLPIMVTLLMGMWEVGRMAQVQQLLTNSVREGGRQASTGTNNTTSVKNFVINYLKNNGLSTVDVSMVTVVNKTSAARNDPTTGLQMDRYEVSISVPYSSVRWSVLSQLTSVANLTASADWYSMKDVPLTVTSTIPVN